MTRPSWLEEGKQLSRELVNGSVDALEAIVEHVMAGRGRDDALVTSLSAPLRDQEDDIGERARRLAERLVDAVGVGTPLTEIRRDVATPLQNAHAAVSP